MTAAATLFPSIERLLLRRGIRDGAQREAWFAPALDGLGSPDQFPHMAKAVERLLRAIRREEPIALYADRDVDGLTGLAILARSLRTLGAQIVWGSPLAGRGVERSVLNTLLASRPSVLILIDCGSGETEELAWLASQGIDTIVADHHRLTEALPPAFAWIHPAMNVGATGEAPAGCVMAFKLAQALWQSFLGTSDAERMDYFLYDHLDLLALGILADRVPLTGENRILVWHGLRRLARTRKSGLHALLRFFRLLPRTGPITVREATWQIIPLLNAAGRLGEPGCAAELLLTEDADKARDCIDTLLELNQRRRTAQRKSVDTFEKTVQVQCVVDSDTVLVAMAEGLEPSVTGLAAQALVKKYGRPAFLFVDQGEHVVGSGRGTAEFDLFAWIEAHRDLLVKFGGHQGAVGLTARRSDFHLLRERLIATGQRYRSVAAADALDPEASLPIEDAAADWWGQFQSLEPFGPGFPCPTLELTGVQSVEPWTKRSQSTFRLIGRQNELLAEWDDDAPRDGALRHGPCRIIGFPIASPRTEAPFKWIIQRICKHHEQT